MGCLPERGREEPAMHVLVTEAHPGDSDRLVQRLRDAGVRVSLCHEPSEFCRALRLGGRCPLDSYADTVDLVVDVRSGDDELTIREYGVICAERARRPLWVVSADPSAPVVVPAAVRHLAIPATEEELLFRCQRRYLSTDLPCL